MNSQPRANSPVAFTQVQAIGKYALHFKPLGLREGSRTVSLPRRQLDVLAVIAKAVGEIVPKSVLFDKVWQGSFVEPGNLTQTIFLIRKTMGRLPDGGEFVETVPGRGYRLAARALISEVLQLVPEKASLSAIFDSGDPLTEGHFRLMVESIEDYAIYMLDCGGRVLSWNSGAESNTGYSAEEVMGQHYSMFFVPEDVDELLPDRELAKATKLGRYGGEGWRLKKTGERFWASFAISAMRGPGGKLLGFSKIVRDLSQRRRQQDLTLRDHGLLKRERDRLSAAAESSMDALFICEAVRDSNDEIEDFIFTFMNSNVEKVVSIPRHVMLHGKMCQLLSENRIMGLFQAYKRVVFTGVPYIAEVPVQAENVTSTWLRVQAVRLGDGLAITASDITERKRLEQEVAELRKAQFQD